MSETDKPRPLPDALTQPYWDAAAEGRLLVQRCDACDAYQWYPRAHCVACGAGEPAWVEAAGTGRLHTYSVLQKTPNPEFVPDLPYVLAHRRAGRGRAREREHRRRRPRRPGLRPARPASCSTTACPASQEREMTIYLEDYAAGQVFTSVGRTVTEADIMAFAGVSGDFNQLHINEQWVTANTPFTGRIAHGLLVLAISSGLATPGMDDVEMIAYLEALAQVRRADLPGRHHPHRHDGARHAAVAVAAGHGRADDERRGRQPGRRGRPDRHGRRDDHHPTAGSLTCGGSRDASRSSPAAAPASARRPPGGSPPRVRRWSAPT